MDVELIRNYCIKWPAVTEDIKWGDNLYFSVAGKLFCMVSLNYPMAIAFKVPDEEFEELSVRECFIPAPYRARAKWLQVIDLSCLTRLEWEHYIMLSYNLVKARLSKKLQKLHDLE